MELFVTARNGERIVLSAQSGQPLMAPLRDAGLVEAVCGGQAACATCHVHIADEWMPRVGAATGQEADMLDNSLERNERSRLSCQIELDETLDGIVLTVAAEEG